MKLLLSFQTFLLKKYIKNNQLLLKKIFDAEKFLASSDWLCFAYHHLGMHLKVLKQPFPNKYLPSQLAYISSLATCGHHQKAESLAIQYLTIKKLNDEQLLFLATTLAPFLPFIALKAINNMNKPQLLLKSSLLIYTNRPQEAKKILDKLKDNKSSLLLLSNLQEQNHHKRLYYINQFIKADQLIPLFLKDSTQVFNTHNIDCDALLSNRIHNDFLVSIIMTAFNSSRYIEAAIQSLLKQTYQNIEIIVIDDASTDNTKDIISNLVEQDSRIRYFQLPTNIGTFAAKNIGLQFAKGEFITCQDSDDWAHPQKIEHQIQPLINNPKLVCTTSKWLRVQENGLLYARLVYPLLRLNPASPLFRKDIVISKIGGWDCVKTGADSEFLERIKLVFGKQAIHSINKPLTFGSHRDDSLMNATDTGYNAQGLSEPRLKYWEAWRQWHIQCVGNHITPYIDCLPTGKRPFNIPNNLIVDTDAVHYCFSHINSSDSEYNRKN